MQLILQQSTFRRYAAIVWNR